MSPVSVLPSHLNCQWPRDMHLFSYVSVLLIPRSHGTWHSSMLNETLELFLQTLSTHPPPVPLPASEVILLSKSEKAIFTNLSIIRLRVCFCLPLVWHGNSPAPNILTAPLLMAVDRDSQMQARIPQRWLVWGARQFKTIFDGHRVTDARLIWRGGQCMDLGKESQEEAFVINTAHQFAYMSLHAQRFCGVYDLVLVRGGATVT